MLRLPLASPRRSFGVSAFVYLLEHIANASTEPDQVTSPPSCKTS
jgi:hypothetical protein